MPTTPSHGTIATLALSLSLFAVGPARAQTGVSDDRVSLPEGPGSLTGIGDDVAIDPNMGAMSFGVPIRVPAGYGALTPNLSLSYSSAGGASVVGMGWSMAMPSIERLTLRGVPRYATDDTFSADGGTQLERVATTGDTQTYRARMEGGFVRYTWHAVGTGKEGYWTAEWPDGRVGTYGADHDGATVASARVGDASKGTFRWLLVDVVDVWGHLLHYGYTASGSTSLLTSVAWMYDGATPTYTVALTYEAREDRISNATGGFEEVLDKRLSHVAVTSAGTTIRSYELAYDSYAASGGSTRLASVAMRGVGDELYPAVTTFAYSQSLGGICADATCAKPFVQSMGSILTGLSTGHVTLLDLDGDALPDIVDSSIADAPHRIFMNVLGSDSHTFAAPKESALGSQNEHDFAVPGVQVLDANGDGFTDVVNAKTGRILYNKGGGDWAEDLDVWADGASGLPELTESELEHLRFLDYDGDKRIDVIRSSGVGAGNSTVVYRNTGTGFAIDDHVDALAVGFDGGDIELNDINGDGLLDVAQVQTTQVRYWLDLGWGHWSDARTILPSGAFSLSADQAKKAELEDINGDGQADLVLVSGTTVRLWINRNGETFDPERQISDAELGSGSLPDANAVGTVVLLADMNANGSSDVVWVSGGGDVHYLELYPVRPNLLTRIENGLGWVSEVSYGTSVQHMARDREAGRAWTHRIPFPNAVVDELDEHDVLTNVHRVTRYAYHDGFYDGDEKSFRGFASVEESLAGDESQEEGLTLRSFDVGDSDPYRAGKPLTVEVRSGGRSLEMNTQTWVDCPLDGVADATPYDVRLTCLSRNDMQRREGADASAWKTIRSEYAYDGFGNITVQNNSGDLSQTGDELVTQTAYVTPVTDTDGRWLVGLPWQVKSGNALNADVHTEQTTYYDGADFEGLEAGKASKGFVSRVVAKADATTDVTVSRARADAHGNTVEEIDALGTPGGDDHRRAWEYDALGRFVTAVEQHLTGPEGAYLLRREFRYEPLWQKPALATGWFVVQDGAELSARSTTTWSYDAFGRVTSNALPGDPAGKPSIEYSYEIRPDVSRITTRARTVMGGALDAETVSCIDGRGRTFQTREKAADGDWQVDGFQVFTRNDAVRQTFMPWRADSGDCEASPPADTAFARAEFDALGRPTVVHHPATSGDPTTRTVYRPLGLEAWDRTDTDPASPFYETPTVRQLDGLGRLVAYGRTPSKVAPQEWFRFSYSPLGALASATDPMGHERKQTNDRLGRLLKVEDPDRGTITYTYDSLGQRLSRTDAGGHVTRWSWDGTGRMTAQWDDADPTGTRFDFLYDYDWEGGCPVDDCGDAAGDVLAVTWPYDGGTGGDWRVRDARQRMVGLERVMGGVTLGLETDLDNLGHVVAERYPGGHEVDYALDLGGEVTSIDGYIDAVEHDAHGDLTAIELSNGVRESWTYDGMRRLVGVDAVGQGGAKVVSLGYTRNGEGWITGVSDDATPSGQVSGERSFEYDAFGRMLSAKLDEGDATLGETIDFAYDAADNIVSRTSTKAGSAMDDGARSFDAAHPHAVTKVGAMTLAYDARGLMTQRGDWTLGWDGMGRLASATRGSGAAAETVRHTYGSAMDRVRSQTASGDTLFVTDRFQIEEGVASFYVSVGNESIARHQYSDLATTVLSDVAPVGAHDDKITAGDAWVAYAASQGILDASDAPAASPVEHLLAASASLGLIDWGERVTWLHRDVIDNVVAVTDEDGAVVERTDRYPYGFVRGTSTNLAERRGFTDKRSDEVGLVTIGNRTYDPLVGRWTAPDLAFEAIGPDELEAPFEAMGTYLYAWNSPLAGQDEDGAVLEKGDYARAVAIISALEEAVSTGNVRPIDNVAIGNNGLGLETTTMVDSAKAVLSFYEEHESELEQLTLSDKKLKRVRAQFETLRDTKKLRMKVVKLAVKADLTGNALDMGATNATLKNKELPPPPKKNALKANNAAPKPMPSLVTMSKDLNEIQAHISDITVKESLDRQGLIGGGSSGRQRSGWDSQKHEEKSTPNPHEQSSHNDSE
ncbi:MAG: toxin TcdB middle/N-terminal domain-containing protein [Myxococcota bacterium]